MDDYQEILLYPSHRF